MAKFLSRQEVYRIIQRELPPECYPDGPPSAFWATADSDSFAQCVASFYANMERIYENQFPQTADERQVDWEIKVFGSPITGSFTLEQRREKVLSKLRLRPTLNPADMEDLVASFIGEKNDPYDWEYIEWTDANDLASGDTFCWSIGMSQLGYDTYLTGTQQAVHGDDACDYAASDLYLTDTQLLTIREGANTIELRIYDDELDPTVKTALQAALDRFGRASRDHIITENEVHSAGPSGDFYLPPLEDDDV